MRVLRYLTILLMGCLIYSKASPQQLPFTTHYTVNPYTLNPAFAGTENRSQLFLNYRHDWASIPGSPRTYRMNGYGQLANNLFIGGELMSDLADVFYRFKAGVSVSYRLQLASNQYLSFGLAGHLFQSVIRLDQSVIQDSDDPVLRDLDRMLRSNFNTSFGLVYQADEFTIGFGMPVMIRTKEAYWSENSHRFAYERAYNLYLSNRFEIDASWDFTPIILVQKTINQPTTVDLSAMFRYERQFWAGFHYRNSMVFGLNAGFKLINGILFHYSYEFGGGELLAQSGGTHEISIGWSRQLEKTNTRKRPSRRIDYGSYRYNDPNRNHNNRSESPIAPLAPPKRKPHFAPYEKFN